MLVNCRICQKQHDLAALEPSFLRPDPLLEIPEDEREQRALEAKDICAIRDAEDTWRRYFIRVLMPFMVEGMPKAYNWGVWVELTESQYERVNELWSDPKQALEPAFPARVANVLPGYRDSSVLIGMVSLSDPANIPHFHLTDPRDHPLLRQQHSGVSQAQALEWILPTYHPEVGT